MPAADLPIATPQVPSQTSVAAKSVQSASVSGTPPSDAPIGGSDADASKDFVAMLAEIMTADAVPPQNVVAAVTTQDLPTDSTDAPELDGQQSIEALLASSELLRLANETKAAPVPMGSDMTNDSSESRGRAALAMSATRIADTAVASLGADETERANAASTPSLQSPRDEVGVSKPGGETSAFATALAHATPMQSRSVAAERIAVHARVGTPAWTQEVAAKLTYLTERGIQSASLQLSPEHLGPLEIRISIHNDQTSVWFGAAHAETRTALEQALPRLRELFAGQGLNLSDAGVFREAPQQRGKQYMSDTPMSGGERQIDIAVVAARGIVDAYA